MDDLAQTLSSMLEKFKRHRFYYEQNETAIREQLINPLLRTLGWNPEDPEEVQLNVSTKEGIPGYSLLKDGKPILFIEVRKQSMDIEEREVLAQLAMYSFKEGTRYVVLTNGTVWTLVRPFERIVWKADIVNEELQVASRRIITLAKDRIGQIERLLKKAQMVDEVWRWLLKNPEEITKFLLPAVNILISVDYPGYVFEEGELKDLLEERIKELCRLLSGRYSREEWSVPPN